MQAEKVIIVHLRRPKSKSKCPGEMRSDPFWEFGSFGITMCHGNNLMHPNNAEDLKDARFAFAQGGKKGTRLVYLTPPVKIKKHKDRIEAKWEPHTMPFRYYKAPILVSNTDKSHFPQLESTMRAGRPLEGHFGSSFRSRAKALETDLAEELIRVYNNKRRNAPDSAIAKRYCDALPWPPPKVDEERKRTYSQKLSEARGSKTGSACGSRKSARCGSAPTKNKCASSPR